MSLWSQVWTRLSLWDTRRKLLCHWLMFTRECRHGPILEPTCVCINTHVCTHTNTSQSHVLSHIICSCIFIYVHRCTCEDHAHVLTHRFTHSTRMHVFTWAHTSLDFCSHPLFTFSHVGTHVGMSMHTRKNSQVLLSSPKDVVTNGLIPILDMTRLG